MNIEEVTAAGVEILHLLQDYHRPPAHREMLIDPILYAYMKGRFGPVTRQHHVSVYGSQNPNASISELVEQTHQLWSWRSVRH